MVISKSPKKITENVSIGVKAEANIRENRKKLTNHPLERMVSPCRFVLNQGRANNLFAKSIHKVLLISA